TRAPPRRKPAQIPNTADTSRSPCPATASLGRETQTPFCARAAPAPPPRRHPADRSPTPPTPPSGARDPRPPPPPDAQTPSVSSPTTHPRPRGAAPDAHPHTPIAAPPDAPTLLPFEQTPRTERPARTFLAARQRFPTQWATLRQSHEHW